MKLQLCVLLVLVLAVVPSVLSIRCYVCSGKECDTILNCTSGMMKADTCMYSKIKDKYARSCTEKKTCETASEACKKGNCVISCCQKDLCNKDEPTAAPSKATNQKPVAVIAVVSSIFFSFLYFL